MKTATALEVAARIAKLTELTTIFQVRYGMPTQFPSQPLQEVYNLHQAILYHQFVIASLLDEVALTDPLPQRLDWWETQATLDPATVQELAQEANQLIASCAYVEASPQYDRLLAADYSQAIIAGMLHPEVRQAALGKRQLVSGADSSFSRN